VLICGAGKAAHLAGAVAAHSTLPVIGVPIAAGGMGGLDALLSTVQMPTGIPVATVAVDSAANAAYLAVAVLAATDPGLAGKLDAYREGLKG
jgi:5-(carboxyamino)imidazole ribonucleotide mutase